jgi:hypothetical protein
VHALRSDRVGSVDLLLEWWARTKGWRMVSDRFAEFPRELLARSL